MNEVFKTEPVLRSFLGMRDALFDMWDSIRNKTVDVHEAEVATKIAAGICKTVEVEIKIRKMQVASAIAEKPQEPNEFLLGTTGRKVSNAHLGE